MQYSLISLASDPSYVLAGAVRRRNSRRCLLISLDSPSSAHVLVLAGAGRSHPNHPLHCSNASGSSAAPRQAKLPKFLQHSSCRYTPPPSPGGESPGRLLRFRFCRQAGRPRSPFCSAYGGRGRGPCHRSGGNGSAHHHGAHGRGGALANGSCSCCGSCVIPPGRTKSPKPPRFYMMRWVGAPRCADELGSPASWSRCRISCRL